MSQSNSLHHYPSPYSPSNILTKLHERDYNELEDERIQQFADAIIEGKAKATIINPIPRNIPRRHESIRLVAGGPIYRVVDISWLLDTNEVIVKVL